MTPRYPRHRIRMDLAACIFLIVPLLFVPGTSKAQTARSYEKIPEEAERIPVDKLISLKAREAAFKIVAGEGEGKIIPMTLKATADKEEWTLTFEKLYRLVMHRAPDGSVQVNRMELLERKERIVFQPSFILIPALIEAGLQIQKTGRVEVYDLETGEQSYAGTYTETLDAVSRTDFTTPAGTIKGYLVEYEFQIHLDYALIRIDLESGWSEDQRLVHWRSKRTVEKLGLFGDTTYRSLAVADNMEEN